MKVPEAYMTLLIRPEKSMSKIKLLERTPAQIILWNAICETEPKDFLLEKFKLSPDGDNTEADVKVFVNGVEVDFTLAFATSVQLFFDRYEKHIKEKAVELITASSVSDLYNSIQNAEWSIKTALDKLEKATS